MGHGSTPYASASPSPCPSPLPLPTPLPTLPLHPLPWVAENRAMERANRHIVCANKSQTYKSKTDGLGWLIDVKLKLGPMKFIQWTIL